MKATAIVFASVMGLAASGYAQTGKISAKIVDAKTGEALVRATVQIVETKQGALSKDNGVATIINVAPNDNYTVIAKYASYQPQTIKGVKVASSITTDLVFKLSSSMSDTVVIRADSKMVEKSKTEVSRKFGESEVANTPGKNTLNEIIALTPGVYKDNSNGGISVNGSRGTSNSIRIGNVDITDPMTGKTSALQSSLSKLAVSEISVTTAGADASHGNATGGFINSSTRSGSSEFEMQLHYRTEVPALWGKSGNNYKQMPAGDRIYEALFAGPITSDITYSLTGKLNSRQYDNVFNDGDISNGGLAVVDPWGNNSGQLPHNAYYSRSLQSKLSFNLLGFMLDADAVFASETDEINSAALIYSDPVQLPVRNELNNLYSLTAKTQIGEGLLELVGSYVTLERGFSKADPSVKPGLFKLARLYNPEDKYTFDENSRQIIPGADGIIDIYTPISRQISDPLDPATPKSLSGTGINPITGRVEGNAITFSTANAYGLNNFFVVGGNVSGYSFDDYNTINFNAKYNQQVASHLLNFGFESSLYHLVGFENQQPYDPNPFKDSIDIHSFYGAAYIVDKMEFSDITFNPSLRFDIFSPGSDRMITDLYNPVVTEINARPGGGFDTITHLNVAKAPLQTQLSPRLGITYAVTEQTTFNFNYGWYFKKPNFNDIIQNTGGNLGAVLSRGNQILGSGGLKAEQTKEITVGFNSQLSTDFSFMVQGVYKDLRNHAGLQRISGPLLPVGYTIYSDDQYGNARSVQFTADKRMSNNWSLRVNYTYSVAKGTSSSSTENYARLINIDPNSENVVLPQQPFNLAYDKPHIAQVIFNLGWGKDEGPTIFGSKILQQLSWNSTTDFQSGKPYTRLNERGIQAGEFNADRHPSYFQTDASLTRTIDLGDLFGESFASSSIDLQLEISNLFNRTEALFVYPTTGQGDDDGSLGTYGGTAEYVNNPLVAGQLDAFGRLLYNPTWDRNRDGRLSRDEQQQAYTQFRSDRLARRTNYQIPRRVFFNVSVKF